MLKMAKKTKNEDSVERTKNWFYVNFALQSTDEYEIKWDETYKN